MGNDPISKMLVIFLIIFGVILFLLIIVYLFLMLKTKSNNKKSEVKIKDKKKVETEKVQNTNLAKIEKFMEFEKVEDNMIIQKENYKYIMVVECQGVNYDLMSELEKNGVEEGFLQFLNTLRHPIQLYIQTRTINLESSINTYKARVQQIEEELFRKKQEYKLLEENPNVSAEEKQKAFYALTKQSNLYEYGKDIINDTQKMSLNSSILSKKYYVVIPYYVSDLGESKFSDYEIRNIAFSELYTRAQAIIRTLSACNVKGKILNSKELIELLYVAYNREHQEDYNFDKALNAEYDKLYSTSEDVFKKKIRALDNQIEEKAIEKAKQSLDNAKTEMEKQAKEKEEQMEDLINQMAKIILQGNKTYIGDEIVDEAIKNIENEGKEEKNEKKSSTKRNSRKK